MYNINNSKFKIKVLIKLLFTYKIFIKLKILYANY